MKKEKLTLLVSRFNCPHPVWENKSREEYVRWLQNRLDLFCQYTLKSYHNLNTKPDQWMILVDKEQLDSETFAQLSDLIQGEKCQLVPYQVNLRQSILEDLIKTYGVEDFPREVRTTRLDTDDLISQDFFDKINTVVLEDNISQLLISFPGGANYDAETGLFYYSSYPDNPFITLCQKTKTPDEFKCVYDQMHTVFYKVAQKNLYIRSMAPMWCSVIHRGNLANQGLRQTNKVALASDSYTQLSFGINLVRKQETMKYQDFLSTIHEQLKPKYYVEIGIREGAALALSQGMSIGIDPDFKINVETQSFVKLFRCTSDDFFKKYNLRHELNNQSCQFAFIDGLHLFEYALRDFRNLETYCEPESVIIFDDVRPRNLKEAERKPTGGAWTGDIWKIYYCLKKYRPDLKLSLIHTQPTGLLLVTHLDPTNRNLWDSYDQILEEFLSSDFGAYPTDDYFNQFTMPEDFLQSDVFEHLKSAFEQKFIAEEVNQTQAQLQQVRQEIEEVLDQHRAQLQEMMATFEESYKKHQQMVMAELEKLRSQLQEQDKQNQVAPGAQVPHQKSASPSPVNEAIKAWETF